ncbi:MULTISPECIES: co-chaperone HscB [unclassified Shewanella]|uniref:co-chaperone HscB n=1 Tax=unclassified Shewanella TaxID=196818 RepID=UPI000C862DA4|nr:MULTISPECIES: co-chaperone HscB [unclassified Shewanella]MDO6619450.1 co-chaperone HscB [Shewanella sp. 6_MG-2023]MDO6639404.1 co-chaperone HscB [Shewanella sp. 5_MG-2023]MDO6678165.1 co-chaperone HscB [Shewanella sp. 4_MG-2023]MDO6775904.1 co-chaperone HscB [Shewanella sp. 3_MG-2023]PMG30310.1 co-chaperone HscB [Shewanella sp. 10N.286.52.C2]
MNYFELFQFSPSFDIDIAQLAERYRELQRAVHPDKFANGSEQQKLLSVQRTAQVNDGYQTLKNPLRRAEHILSLRGIDISHETTTVKDTAFLMQQMEWREALEDIEHSQQPDDLISDLFDSFADFEKSLSQSLAILLVKDTDNDNLLAADQIRKLKFMAKLQDELAKIEDSLLD